MNTHLTEDQLVLHYYGEMAESEERLASEHLSGCGQCHAAFTRLQRVLAMVDETAAAPVLPESFERTVWARLQQDLPLARPNWFAWVVLSPARMAWAAAVVVLVTGAFFAGRLLPRSETPSVETVRTAGDLRERILMADLGDHLERSQTMLVELVSADAEAGFDVGNERDRAEQLVAANRLYRQTAATAGDGSIVAFLDELERILVDLAASPEEMSAEELAAVRRRIDSEGLLFKVRVLSSQLRDRQKGYVQERAGRRSSL
jgi:predicted anti-sigma-YlaC factor YlaD